MSSTGFLCLLETVSRISYVVEETVHAAVLHRAIINLTGMENLIIMARYYMRENGKDDSALEAVQRETKGLEERAKKLIASDFHAINSHGLLGLWSALETAVEDTIVLILLKDEEAIHVARKAGYKVKPRFTQKMDEAEARKLYSALESQARKNCGVGEAYCNLLSTFGLNLELDSNILQTLDEINAVRNCILHKAGFIDDKAIEESPTLARFHEKRINISSNLYLSYYDAVGKFAAALSGAAIRCKYMKTVS